MKLVRIFKRFWPTLMFLFGVLLIKLPPLYHIGIKSAFLTTHSLARFLIFFLFIFVVGKEILGTSKNRFLKSEKILIFIFLIYFLFQSFSIFGAVEIESFISGYKDIVFPAFFFFVALNQKNFLKYLSTIFLVTSVFNFAYQMLIFWFPTIFKIVAEAFVYSQHLQLVNVNIQRGRIFTETYDEIAVPFLFLLIYKEKTTKMRLIYATILLMVIIPSLLSNFRTRSLMLFFSLGISLLFVIKSQLKIKLLVAAGIFLLAILAHFVSVAVFGFSYLDRLVFENQAEDVKTVLSRVENLKTSFEMGISHPITGVGLNNYYFYLPVNKKSIFTITLNTARRKQVFLAQVDPHNVFAQVFSETGLLSLGFFVFMLGYFASADFKLLKTGSGTKKSLVISFWTLFIYSLFNPTSSFAYNSLFWLIRVAIL